MIRFIKKRALLYICFQTKNASGGMFVTFFMICFIEMMENHQRQHKKESVFAIVRSPGWIFTVLTQIIETHQTCF